MAGSHKDTQQLAERRVADGVLALVQVGLFFTAWVGWFYVTFWVSDLDRAHYLGLLISFGVPGVLLGVGLLPARALRCSTWVMALHVLMAATCLALGADAAQNMWRAGPIEVDYGDQILARAIVISALSPASLGMVVLIAATPLFRRSHVRASSSPALRSSVRLRPAG